MSTVEGKKQEKRRALLDAAYELFLERGTAKTSVEDITSRAKVGKGTFYLYFQDKGAVMQALLGRVSYQLLSDACLAVEQHPELPDFTAQVVFVIDHIIEALRQDVLVLRFLERISIARAILKDAPIVILDEATANVDPENEDRLQKAIEALTRDKTILMIAHRLKTVRNADQILVLDGGQIVQRGTHSQLMAQEGLYQAFVSGRKESGQWKL